MLVALSVVARIVSPVVLAVYLVAIVACYAYVRETPITRLRWWPSRADWSILTPLILVQLICLQFFASFPTHYLQDEFITAYTSASLPAVGQIDWFGAYPPSGEWLTQFPVLFFLLQKPFFMLLGPSVESIQISTWPYDVLIIVFLYLLGLEVFRSWEAATGTAVVYVTLAPNLYIASLGVHFVSSTLFFLAAFYFLVLLQRRRDRTYALLCGLFAALAYLTYASSYVTLPLLLGFVALLALWQRSLLPFRLFTPAAAIWCVAMLPFVIFATMRVNYFTSRADQVNLLSSLKDAARRSGGGAEVWSILRRQVVTNIQSLDTPGLGGVNDYWFGHQALFNQLTFDLLLLGMTAALVYAFVWKRRELLFVIAAVVATFIFGMFLTVPPGAFHRTSLAYPFVALLIVLGIQTIGRGLAGPGGKRRIGQAVLTTGVAIVAVANVQGAITMVKADEQISIQKDDRYLGQYLQENLSTGSRVYIAADPNYHLQRELYFRTADQYDVTTDFFPKVVGKLGASPLIVLNPTPEQRSELARRYPLGKIVDQVNGYHLERHLIFLPRGAPS